MGYRSGALVENGLIKYGKYLRPVHHLANRYLFNISAKVKEKLNNDWDFPAQLPNCVYSTVSSNLKHIINKGFYYLMERS